MDSEQLLKDFHRLSILVKLGKKNILVQTHNLLSPHLYPHMDECLVEEKHAFVTDAGLHSTVLCITVKLEERADPLVYSGNWKCVQETALHCSCNQVCSNNGCGLPIPT